MKCRNNSKFKKILAACMLGAGIGIFLIIILPPKVWLVIISIGLIVIGIKKLF